MGKRLLKLFNEHNGNTKVLSPKDARCLARVESIWLWPPDSDSLARPQPQRGVQTPFFLGNSPGMGTESV